MTNYGGGVIAPVGGDREVLDKVGDARPLLATVRLLCVQVPVRRIPLRWIGRVDLGVTFCARSDPCESGGKRGRPDFARTSTLEVGLHLVGSRHWASHSPDGNGRRAGGARGRKDESGRKECHHPELAGTTDAGVPCPGGFKVRPANRWSRNNSRRLSVQKGHSQRAHAYRHQTRWHRAQPHRYNAQHTHGSSALFERLLRSSGRRDHRSLRAEGLYARRLEAASTCRDRGLVPKTEAVVSQRPSRALLEAQFMPTVSNFEGTVESMLTGPGFPPSHARARDEHARSLAHLPPFHPVSPRQHAHLSTKLAGGCLAQWPASCLSGSTRSAPARACSATPIRWNRPAHCGPIRAWIHRMPAPSIQRIREHEARQRACAPNTHARTHARTRACLCAPRTCYLPVGVLGN